jgi:hypothetical protein
MVVTGVRDEFYGSIHVRGGSSIQQWLKAFAEVEAEDVILVRRITMNEGIRSCWKGNTRLSAHQAIEINC